jgi:hypothetical protein
VPRKDLHGDPAGEPSDALSDMNLGCGING